jgi:hypothetical protein
VQVHQALHISQFQKDFFGIAVFLIFLEERSTVVQNTLIALFINDPADLYQSLHVIFLLVQLDRLLVVLACDE